MITVNIPFFNIRKIADSGQCFRLNRTEEKEWTLIAFGKVLFIRELPDGAYRFSCTETEFRAVWRRYFDLDACYDCYAEKIPKSDRFLTEAAAYSEGIRILNQDPWETLVTFIISQRRSIPAIKTAVERLSEKFGKPVRKAGKTFYAFPTPAALTAAGTEGILSCSVGYRAPYIYGAARMVLSGELDLNGMARLSDPELLSVLLSVRGVGIKVANCVMLFGFHRIDSFPVDVWIQRMIDLHYNGRFPLRRYSGFAGIIQQYMFFYGREKS